MLLWHSAISLASKQCFYDIVQFHWFVQNQDSWLGKIKKMLNSHQTLPQYLWQKQLIRKAWSTNHSLQLFVEPDVVRNQLFRSLVLCPAVHAPQRRMSGGWLEFLAMKVCAVNVQLLCQECNVFSICWSICCVAPPSSSQQCSLTIKASVTSEKSGKLFDFSHQTWAKTAGNILPSRKLANRLNLPISRFVVAQSLKASEWWCTEFSLSHKNHKPWNIIEVTILNFDDVGLLIMYSAISLLISHSRWEGC